MYRKDQNWKIAGLIPVAGMSRRMGTFKPLMKIGEKTVIECVVDNMLSAGVGEIVVVLGHRGNEIREVIEESQEREGKVKFAYNPAYKTTHMLDSIQCGLKEMSPCDWFFITPGDMPAISRKTYEILLKEAKKEAKKERKKIIFPTVEGYRKHPPLISGNCTKDISAFQGNGLREYWSIMQDKIAEVDVLDKGCTMDMDFRDDYSKVCHYVQSEKPYLPIHLHEAESQIKGLS